MTSCNRPEVLNSVPTWEGWIVTSILKLNWMEEVSIQDYRSLVEDLKSLTTAPWSRLSRQGRWGSCIQIGSGDFKASGGFRTSSGDYLSKGFRNLDKATVSQTQNKLQKHGKMIENDQSSGRSGQKKQELEALEIQGLEVKIVRQVIILEGHYRLKGSQASYTAFCIPVFVVFWWTVCPWSKAMAVLNKAVPDRFSVKRDWMSRAAALYE